MPFQYSQTFWKIIGTFGKFSISNNKYFKVFHLHEGVFIPFHCFFFVRYGEIQTYDFNFTSSLLMQKGTNQPQIHNTTCVKYQLTRLEKFTNYKEKVNYDVHMRKTKKKNSTIHELTHRVVF